MFEIPDDDDENFWEDLPLDDITIEKKSLQTNASIVMEKRQLRDCQAERGNKKCSNGVPILNVREEAKDITEERTPSLPISHSLQSLENNRHSILQSVFVPDTQDCVLHPKSANTRGDVQNSYAERLSTPSIQDVHCVQDNTDHAQESPCSVNSKNATSSRKRKRKFPGPAGLLPKLMYGQTLDSPDLVMKKNPVSKSPDQVPVPQKEDVVLLSQSSEDFFNDTPWQTLLKDLGEAGQVFLNKFSVTSSLQKARKKQLPKGKVPLVIGVIESLDWSGTDASVCLRDKSGRIHGTVHQNVMKEHELQFQPGSAVVLRQVSVISPTTRNHYLNITPANVVCIYCNKEGHNKLSDVPLPSFLRTLEQEVQNDLLQNRLFSPKTPQHGGHSNRENLQQTGKSPYQTSSIRHSAPIHTPQRQQLQHQDTMHRTPPGLSSKFIRTPQTGPSFNRTPQPGPSGSFIKTPQPPPSAGLNTSHQVRPNGNFIKTLQMGPARDCSITPQPRLNDNLKNTFQTGQNGYSVRVPSSQAGLGGKANTVLNQTSATVHGVDSRLNSLRTPLNSSSNNSVTQTEKSNSSFTRYPVTSTQTSLHSQALPINQTSSKFRFKSQTSQAIVSLPSGGTGNKMLNVSVLQTDASENTNNNCNTTGNQSVIHRSNDVSCVSDDTQSYGRKTLNSSANIGEQNRHLQNMSMCSTKVLTHSVDIKHCQTPKTKWSFKSKKTSPDICQSLSGRDESPSPDICQSLSGRDESPGASLHIIQNNKNSVINSLDSQKNKCSSFDVDSLWQDDLSDDLLSQLSDDM